LIRSGIAMCIQALWYTSPWRRTIYEESHFQSVFPLMHRR
jgi:hypothetical protein